MGFGDFFSAAVGAVKNLVSHSPIVKALAPLAGIIAQAVPIVGPIINNAVPALEAIFSKDNASPNPGEDPKPLTPEQLNAPVLVELKRQHVDIQAILKTVQDITDDLGAGIQKLQDDFKDKLELTVQEIQTMFAKQLYDKLYTGVRAAAGWIENHQSLLKVTAQDGPDKFKPLLFDQGNLLQQREKLLGSVQEIETDIKKAGVIPSQQMLDLYLLAVHWLLIFDKVFASRTHQGAELQLTVDRLSSSLEEFTREPSSYLEAVNNLTNDINDLRTDAINARDVLQIIVTEVPKGREDRVKILYGPDPDKTPYIEDSWPPLSVGWMPLPSLRKELGLDDNVEMKSHKALALGGINPNIVLKLWQQYAVQAVEFSLGPSRAVISHLEANIRQWNSRVPVGPTKNLPAGHQHIKADIVTTKNKRTSPSMFLKKESFVGKDLNYTLTYCNTYGESFSSAWSEQRLIEEDTYAVQLNLHPIKFDNDPLDALEPIRGPDGKEIAPQRSVRRRLYVGYTDDHGQKDVTIYLGEIGEQDETVYHVFQERAVEDIDDPL
ncbi:hypothetical protein BJX99DRAFT_258296 [Aspergillus californicus]